MNLKIGIPVGEDTLTSAKPYHPPAKRKPHPPVASPPLSLMVVGKKNGDDHCLKKCMKTGEFIKKEEKIKIVKKSQQPVFQMFRTNSNIGQYKKNLLTSFNMN